jgi:hypothetical protein
MAAKLGSGAGEYEDLANWSAWVMSDWRAGVGKKDPQAGGFLFSTAETRFEGQVIMPSRLAPWGQGFAPLNAYQTSITIGTGQTYSKVSVAMSLTTTESVRYLTAILPGSGYEGTATQAKVEIWSDTAGAPNAMLLSATVTLLSEPGYFHHLVDLTTLGPPGGTTTYHMVIYPVSGYMTLVGDNNGGQRYNGSAWSASMKPPVVAHVNHPGTVITHITSFNGHVYMAANGSGSFSTLWRLTAVGLLWTGIKTYGTFITSLLPIGSKLYIGLGDSTNYDTMNAAESFTAGSVPARLFALHNGYLWRAVTTNVMYTSDESTWTTIDIADGGYAVRGMAGFQDDMIVSTDNTLYRVAFGDIVRFVANWGNADTTNGKYMLNFQGNLYISQGGSIIRYDGAGLLPFGVDLGEGLPTTFVGNVVGLAANNNWMVVAIDGTTYGSVWVHNGSGWHCLQRVPAAAGLNAIGYLPQQMAGSDTEYLNAVGIGCQPGIYYSTRLPDTARSTYQLYEDANLFSFHPTAVIETDWFYGGLREVYKDFESVYIDGDNLSATNYIDVYWQDEGSAGVWELLGRVDSAGEELRWSNYNTRPNSRKLKLKLVFTYFSGYISCRVKSVRVKFMPMIRDRYRFQAPILVAANVEAHNYDLLDTYTIAQQLTHLDGLTNQVAPFILKWIDGNQYEVKMLDAVQQVAEFNYTSTKVTKFIYNLSMEQVTAGTYSA